MGASRFERTTSVLAHGDGRYTGEIGEEWNCPIVPQGGTVVATLGRAMGLELEESDQQLRSVSAVFAGQVRHGPVEIDVQVLRRGRSMSQCSATLHNPGTEAGTTGIAVFGAPRRGFAFTDLAPPEVPPPLECPSFRDPVPVEFEMREPFDFWKQVEGRPAIGHPPWDEYEPSSSLRAIWYRFDEPVRLDDGRWDPLALVALCDTMPGAVGERLGPRPEAWLPPSADLTVHVLDDARAEWILAVNRARHAGDGYASVDMELWDMEAPAPKLVAYGTQVMFFSFPKK
jgi:acyl-CoA thioesterase